MNSTTPTEVQVVTEMDVYAASVRKVVSNGNLNASPLVEPSYSWSDVETEEQVGREKKNKVEELSKVEEKPNVEEQPKVEDKSDAAKLNLTKSELNEHLDKLMSTIADIVNTDSNIKVDVELESDEDMSEIVENNDMPELVDSDSDMPDLVEDSGSENEWTPHADNDDLMVAVFKRPSCARCEAALKILLAHEENTNEDVEFSEQEHTSDDDTDESAEENDSSTSEDESDSEYVPSETESEQESPRTVRQLRRWSAERTSEFAQNRQTSFVPSLIKYIFTVLVVIHILKFLLNEPHQRIRCYS